MICSNCKTSITLPFAVDKCPNCGFILDKKSKNDIVTIDNPFNQNKVLNKISFEIGANFLSKYKIDSLIGYHSPFSFYEVSLDDQSFILQLYSIETELHKSSIDIFNFLFSKYPYLPDKLINMYEYGIYDKDIVYFVIENYPQNSLNNVLNTTTKLSYEYIINLMSFTLELYEEINSPHLFLSPKEIISMGDNRFKVKNFLTIRFLANMIEPSFFFNEDRYSYMAPELKSGMLILTKKADLFSIGKIWEKVLNLEFLSQSDQFVIFKEKIISIIDKITSINPDDRIIDIDNTKKFLNEILTEIMRNELNTTDKLSLATLEIEIKDDANFEAGISTSLDLKESSFEEKLSESIKFGDNEFLDDEVTSDLKYELLKENKLGKEDLKDNLNLEEKENNKENEESFDVSLDVEDDKELSSFSDDDFSDSDELNSILEHNAEKEEIPEEIKEQKEFNLKEEIKSSLNKIIDDNSDERETKLSSSIDLSKDVFDLDNSHTSMENIEIEIEDNENINIQEDILFDNETTSSSIDLSKDIFEKATEEIKEINEIEEVEDTEIKDIEVEIEENNIVSFDNETTSSSIDLSKDIFEKATEEIKEIPEIEEVEDTEIKDIDIDIEVEIEKNNIVSFDNETTSSSIDLSKDIFEKATKEIEEVEEIEIEIDIDDIDEDINIDANLKIEDLEKFSTSDNFDFENLSGSIDFSKKPVFESMSSSMSLEDEPTRSYDDVEDDSNEQKNSLDELFAIEEDVVEIDLDELEDEHLNIFKDEDDSELEEITIVELDEEEEEDNKKTKKITKNQKVKNPPKLKVTPVTKENLKALRESLNKKPLDLDKIKKVYAYYVENDEIDKAYVISNILNFMNELSDSELIFKNGRKFQWEYNENILTEENLALLFTKEIYLNTSGIMIVLKDFLQKKKHLVSTVIPPLTTSSPIALRSRKGKIIKDLIDLTGLKNLRIGTTKDISSNEKIFSVLYQKKSHTHLTVRKDIFEELDTQHFKVIMAKYMFLAHPEIIPNFVYDVPTIEEIFYGTMKFTIPFIRDMHDSKLSNSVHEELTSMKKTKSLSQKDIIKLVIVMNEHFAQRKQYPDIKTSLKNIEIISDRFALLASNDLNSTLKTFLNYKDINIRLNPRERMNALLKFVMSDEYFQLRKNLKQSVKK